MERLGLWGEGATFQTFEDFLSTVQKKGLGMFISVRQLLIFKFSR